MNYLTEERRHALAAEYVVGTLRGSARTRFQRLMLQFPQIKETTHQWEVHINGLGEQLQPIPPDKAVWDRIVERLDMNNLDGLPENVVKLVKKQPNWWKAVSVFATAAALVLAVLLVRPVDYVPQQAGQFTVVQNAESKALWLIEIFTQTIDAKATSNVTLRAQNDYQLWMVPKDGTPPVSLGLLPQSGNVSLPKVPIFDQIEIAALAVSLEPLGGSPTGSPTEVLFISELATL